MKKVLIISPYFPPVNAADMQRVRMSLPYFECFGWIPEVVAVDPQFVDMPIDPLFNESRPKHIKIHYIRALDSIFTKKIGLGSIALRALPFYKRFVNRLLREEHYDLIYFSTTQFPVCRLGPYWKRNFDVPYVIDMQDPWHTDYYQDKPRALRPKKHWFSYRLNKVLERPTMNRAEGLISVSDTYIETLKLRYPQIRNIPSATITFGAFAPDLGVAVQHADEFPNLLSLGLKRIVYIGRGGGDMTTAISKLLEGFAHGLDKKRALFENIRMYFIGTSYAPNGAGEPTVLPLARNFNLEKYVVEITDRIGFFHTLATLSDADALFIPGSDAPGYTASKIYPYLLTSKPILAIFKGGSPALDILRDYGVWYALSFDQATAEEVSAFLTKYCSKKNKPISYNPLAMEHYSAHRLTGEQCNLFERVMAKRPQLKAGK